MLDLRNFKKMGSTKTHTIFQHPDGHEIHVAHDKLPHEAKQEMAAIPSSNKKIGGMAAYAKGGFVTKKDPNYADGGPVDFEPGKDYSNAPLPGDTTSELLPQTDPVAQTNPYSEPMGGGLQALQQGMAPAPTPTQAAPEAAPEPQQAPGAPSYANYQLPAGQTGPQGDIFGAGAMEKAYGQGLNESKAGLAQEAKAVGQQGQAEAAVAGQGIQGMQAVQAEYQKHVQDLTAERQAFIQDVSAGHIDPNHWMASRSTGGKIATVIGLILGGLGGADVGKFVNDQISHDIDAQKANMGNRQTLLEANLHQFKNIQDATDMSRLMMMDGVKLKMQQAASQAQDPLAKGRMLQEMGKLDMQAAPIMSQMAARRAMLSGMNRGTVPPAAVIQTLVPEHHQTMAYKELQDAQNMAASKSALLTAFDKAKQINTVGNRVLHPIQSPKQVDALVNPLIAQLSKDSAGRFTEADAGMIRGLMPRLGDDEKTLNMRRKQLNDVISHKMHFPILDLYGIMPKAPASSGSVSAPANYKR